MSRIYYNTGTAGREYSKLLVSKYSLSPQQVELKIERAPEAFSVVLNREQMVDLITQLEICLALKASLPPVIEGSL